MGTSHKLVIGDCQSMQELENESVHLMVTSPPYFNAPFDYEGLYDTDDHYLGVLANVASIIFKNAGSL